MSEHSQVEPETLDSAWIPRINPHFRFQWEEAQQSYVLLYPEGMVKLNQSAGEILSCCDGTASIGAITGRLQQKFPDAAGLEADVREFMCDALNRRWLTL